MTIDAAGYPLGQPIDAPLFDPGDELAKNDEESYRIAEFIGRGGTGEVYRISSTIHGSNRIVKLFLPFYYFEKLKRIGLFPDSQPRDFSSQIFSAFESLKISDREYATLAELNHPFIVPVHSRLRIQLPRKAMARLASQFELPEAARVAYGIVASYVQGIPLLEYARDASGERVLETLRSVAIALDYLNLDREILHCDVKSDNILIQRSDGLPVVVDFGLAQRAQADAEDRLISVSTELMPTFNLSTLASAIRRQVLNGEQVRRSDFMNEFWPWLDRYQFGLLLGTISEYSQLRKPEQTFLASLARNLGDERWLRAHADRPLAPYVERADSNRTYGIVRAGARESDLRIPSPMRRINVPRDLQAVAQHPALVRLNRLNQLSLLPARFPGATHTRYLHSLDAYRLARALCRRLLDRSEFRSLMSEQEVVLLLVAAMLHDVNHLPLLHVIQELADPDKEQLPDPFHLAFDYHPWTSDSLDNTLEPLGISRVLIGSLTRQGGGAARLLGRPLTPQEHFIRSVVDSGIDVDKMSYLQLDSVFSGLGFASGIDIEGLFDAATVGYHGDKPVLAFHSRGTVSVESVVRARVAGFESLYWCDENRAMMACVLEGIRLVLARDDGVQQISSLLARSVGSTDYGFLERLDRILGDSKTMPFLLSSFFDGAWDLIEVAYRSDDAGRATALRSMPASTRLAVDRSIRRGIISQFGGQQSTSLVLVDAPARSLTLGGKIFELEGGRTTETSSTGQYASARERLERISRTITIFVDRGLHNLMPERKDERDRAIEDIVDEALSDAGTNWE